MTTKNNSNGKNNNSGNSKNNGNSNGKQRQQLQPLLRLERRWIFGLGYAFDYGVGLFGIR
jgi:hypothetical protein